MILALFLHCWACITLNVGYSYRVTPHLERHTILNKSRDYSFVTKFRFKACRVLRPLRTTLAAQ